MASPFAAIIRRAKRRDRFFVYLAFALLVLAMIALCALIGNLLMDGMQRISPQFLTSFPSRHADQAGVLSSWVGSTLVMIVTATCAIPIGIAAGVYLEEYAPKNKFTTFIEINISNLAGVPSIVYGLMALGLFVYKFSLGQSIATAGLTLALLILPVVIVSTREAIRTIPGHIREASFAVGATRWQTVWFHILPYSMGGILTGVIIALSRAIGETAPLLTVGALSFIAFLPHPPIQGDFPWLSFQWLMDPYTVLPIQMFNWVSRPQPEFHLNAAAAGVILVTMTLTMNAAAIFIRHSFRKKIKW